LASLKTSRGTHELFVFLMSKQDPQATYIVSMALRVLDVWETERPEGIDAPGDPRNGRPHL
jgi:hypothetical protein